MGEKHKVEKVKKEEESEKHLKNLKNKKSKIITISVIAIIVIAVLALFLGFKYSGKKPTASLTHYTINYKLSNNGNVIDSGNLTFMEGSLHTQFGFVSSKIDDIVSSMPVGQEKTITLNETEAYGSYNPALIYEINRTEEMKRRNELNKTFLMPKDSFVSYFKEQPIVDHEYSASLPWKLKVVSVNNTSVKINHEAKIGDVMPTGMLGLTRKVVQVTNNKIVTMIEGSETSRPLEYGTLNMTLDDNYVYFTLTPLMNTSIKIGSYPKSRVINLTSDKIILDANPKYAGKSITVWIKLGDKKAESLGSGNGGCIYHPNKPTLQFFIMSYCPYGLQMLKGVLPVWKLLKDDANIQLRFVSYTMHGPKEDKENKRMVCIREEQCNKLLDYLNCYVTGAGYSTCLKQAGVDESKLDACMNSKADQYLAMDKQLNSKYGVKGSPTVVLNDKVIEMWPRSPENIKEKICGAFSSQPKECQQTLSTENPAPGFSQGASSGGSAAKCG